MFKQYAEHIIRLFGKKDDYKNDEAIYVIDSRCFEEKKNNIHSILTQGFKLFVISTYTTVGAGQNLQYTSPETLELVKINNFSNSENKKDFDAIYLDKPTHLIVNMNKNQVQETDVVKRIFQLESLAQKGTLSDKHLRHEIKKGFTKLSGSKYTPHRIFDAKQNNVYSLLDTSNNAIRILNQAIGRIARCNQKNPFIYIFISDENIKFFEQGNFKNKLLTKEFEEVIKKVDSNFNEIDAFSELKSIGKNNNLKAYKYINLEVEYIFKKQNNERWLKLRNYVLKYPTFNDEDSAPVKLKDYYVELPSDFQFISFSQKNDFKYVEIEFTNDNNANLSPNNCNLPIFLKNEGIKQLFKEKGYATNFKRGKYILTPVLYNNIYKGALGEIIGTYLIEKYCANISFKNLQSHELEFFDAKITNDIYIDFKLWNDNFKRSDRNKTLDEINNKLKKINAKKVLIINIASYKEPVIRQPIDAKIIEIPAIFDLNISQPFLKTIEFINNIGNA